MSNGGGSSGLSSSTGAREHGRIMMSNEEYWDFIMSTEFGITDKDRYNWLKENTSFSDEEAKEIAEAIGKYTGSDWAKFKEGKMKKMREVLDKFLTHKSTPVLKGEIYRGLLIRGGKPGDGEARLLNMLKSGIWHEKGNTSFTSNEGVAQQYARGLWNDFHPVNDVGVVIRVKNNKTGVPVSHLTGTRGESEVLYPSSISKRGFKVLGYESKIQRRFKVYYVDVEER